MIERLRQEILILWEDGKNDEEKREGVDKNERWSSLYVNWHGKGPWGIGGRSKPRR